MRLLLIGDIVGKPGRQIVCRSVKPLVEREQLDLVVANAENAAGGSGITPAIYHELIAAGVDVITLGDHIYRRRKSSTCCEPKHEHRQAGQLSPAKPRARICRRSSPQWRAVAVFSLLGRVFMRPVDCPFKAADRVLAGCRTDIRVILLDFHAEATSDKQLMGRYLDGRVSAVLGHAHARAHRRRCIFPGGTAFQCDVGMTGPYESILGRQIDRVMETTLTFIPTAFDVASGDVRLSGTIVEVDPSTGKAQAIRRLIVREGELV